MSKAIGQTRWAIAEGYIPAYGHGPEPQFTSHETACLLNASDQDAHVEITIYFSDREPVGPYRLTVPARRTKHLRFNDLKDPEPIPCDRDRQREGWPSGKKEVPKPRRISDSLRFLAQSNGKVDS